MDLDNSNVWAVLGLLLEMEEREREILYSTRQDMNASVLQRRELLLPVPSYSRIDLSLSREENHKLGMQQRLAVLIPFHILHKSLMWFAFCENTK